jgi:TolB-like protein/DNA-binding winged helix-turn-helix (wHTH) protein/Tfp pilus assembly protein PilF
MHVPVQSPRRISFRKFELDLASGELYKDGQKVPLPPKAFEVLRALVEYPGEVVTRDDLRAGLWPADTFVEFEDSLNHAVNRLRRVLGDSAEDPQFIETLPRFGYRFIAPTSGNDAPEVPPKPRRRFLVPLLVSALALSAVIAVLLAYDVGGLRRRLMGRPADPAIRSLAVLPLSNLTGDPQQEYFADGMTDALITDLAKIHGVKVISRTSVMQFKNVQKPLPEIARALGVDGIVEGSVQRSGERVRVTAQLIRAATDTHLWSESYERDTRDVLSLQGEIARDVAREIKLALTSEESSHLSRLRPVNPVAYELYLKAQYHYYKWRAEDFREAIEFFQKAIDADPHWAPPYAGLANSYGWLWIAGALPPQEALPRFNAALKTALEIDNTLPEAHYTMAAAAFYYRWDWDEAEREFRTTLALQPSLVEARFEYAWFLSSMGRFPEAIAEARRAVERDPLSVSANLALGSVYSVNRDDDLAIAQLRRTEEIEPNDPRAYEFLSGIYEEKQMYGEAIQQLQKAATLRGAPPAELAGLERAYQQSGPKGYRLWQLAQAKRRNAPYDIAMAYARLGDASQSMHWLEKSYQQHDWQMVQLRSIRAWDPIRSDPRFQDLLRRMNFPQ